MYHEMKVINGVLCHRGTPDGEFIPYSPEDLTGMLQNYHNLRTSIMNLLDLAANYDYLKAKAQNLIVVLFNMPY